MKRLLALLLLIVLFCSACSSQEVVPTYSAPTAEQETAKPTVEESAAPAAAKPTPNGVYPTTDASSETLRLQSRNFVEGGRIYDTTFGAFYCSDDGQSQYCPCQKKYCPHADENCNAWIDPNVNPDNYRMGLLGDVLYLAAVDGGFTADPEGKTEEAPYTLTIHSSNVVTGEKKTYYTVTDENELLLGEVYVAPCGLFFSYAVRERDSHNISTTYFYFYNFKTAEISLVLDFSTLPNVWALTPDGKLIYTVTYASGVQNPFYDSRYDSSYADYLSRLNTTNLLVLDLMQEPYHAKHINSSYLISLTLGDYYSVIGNQLYYALDGDLCTYDLDKSMNDCCLTGQEIVDLQCLDGRIFLQTADGRYLWYIPKDSPLIESGAVEGTLVEYDGSKEGFVPLWETADYFIGGQGRCRYIIEKTAFYQGRYDTAVATSMLYQYW